MKNTHLIKCIKCGHDVSTQARSCPSCGSKGFEGFKYNICRDRLDPDKEFVIDGGESENAVDRRYHWTCIQKYFTPTKPMRCVDCGASLPSLSAIQIAKDEVLCPHCGSQHPLGRDSCGECMLPFVAGIHKRSGSIMHNHVFCDKYFQQSLGGCFSVIMFLLLIVGSGAISCMWFVTRILDLQ